MGRVVRLAISAALGVIGFTATYTLAAREPTTELHVRPAATTRNRVVVGNGLPRAAAGAVQAKTADVAEADDDPGVALFQSVNETYPETGRLTWAVIDQSTARAMTDLVAAHGFPANACGAGGTLDDSILMVQWVVSTRHGDVRIDGGRAVDADLSDEIRGCLDTYLANVKASFPAPEEIVELDILYELPFPASDQRE